MQEAPQVIGPKRGELDMNITTGIIGARRAALVAGLAVCLSWGPAQSGEINTGYFGDIAIKGYDTVAYFTMREAVKGSEEHSVEWLGAVWHFSTAEHQEMFTSSPVQYSPQYGGYCADGVAYGQSTANINPTAWRIVDGKLYLNFSKGAAEELEQTSGQIEKADQNWKDRIHTKVKSQ
jgi:hypothetical protein